MYACMHGVHIDPRCRVETLRSETARPSGHVSCSASAIC